MATWRTKPYSYNGYLFLLKPKPIFKARVNMPNFKYPFQRLIYDDVTLGAYTDIKPNQTLLLGSFEGWDDLGRVRTRLSTEGVATATNVYTGWFSRGTHDGELEALDNAYITVLDDYRVWAKTPRIEPNGDIFKDYKASYSWCHPQPPVANAGSGYAGFAQLLDEGEETERWGALVDFDGSLSFAVQQGSSITNFVWDFVDGTPSSADAATVEGVEFPPGFRWVSLTVTASNSQAHTAFVPVFIATEEGEHAPIRNFQVADHSIAQQGQRISFRVDEEIPRTEYPDGTLVMYWEDERYGDEPGSLHGPAGREHMKFVGWIDTEEERISSSGYGEVKTTILNCVDVAGRLRQVPGFPMVLERKDSPTKWSQLAGLNIDRYVWFILMWHSNALDLADFLWSNTGDTYAIPTLSSDGQSLWDQAAKRTEAIAHLLTCDRFGRLRMWLDPQLTGPSGRTSETQETLTAADIQDLGYTRQRSPRHHWHWGDAIMAMPAQASSDLNVVPLFCVAPGRAPGQGAAESRYGEQVVATQTELNDREGHRYAVRLNPEETYFETHLVHSADPGLEPARLTWVKLTLDPQYAAHRGLAFTQERFLLVEMAIEYDHERSTKDVLLTLERERVGKPAATYIPATGKFAQQRELYIGDYGIEPDYGDLSWYMPSNGRVAVFVRRADDAGGTPEHILFICDNYFDETPYWYPKSLPITGHVALWCPDAFSPAFLGTGSQVNGWLVSDYGIYRITDLWAFTPGCVLKHAFDYEIRYADNVKILPPGVDIDASFGIQNHVVVVYCPVEATNEGARICYTTDGENWTENTINPERGGTYFPAVQVSSKIPGLVYVVIRGAGVQTSSVFKSVDYGESFIELTSTGPFGINSKTNAEGAKALHIPYHNNPNDEIAYFANTTGFNWYGMYSGNLWRVSKGNAIDISPLYQGFPRVPNRMRGGISTAPTNRSRVAACGRVHIDLIDYNLFPHGVPVYWGYALHLSKDGGLTWIRYGGIQASRAFISGDDPDAVWAIGAGIAFSPDFGDTWILGAGLFTFGEIVGLTGNPYEE